MMEMRQDPDYRIEQDTVFEMLLEIRAELRDIGPRVRMLNDWHHTVNGRLIEVFSEFTNLRDQDGRSTVDRGVIHEELQDLKASTHQELDGIRRVAKDEFRTLKILGFVGSGVAIITGAVRMAIDLHLIAN